MIALLLVGCGDDGAASKMTPDTGGPAVTLEVGVPAFDPKLPGAYLVITGAVEPFVTDDCAAELSVENALGQRRALPADLERTDTGGFEGRLGLSTTWDGRDEAGVFFDPGEVALVLTATCGEARTSTTATAWIVRLGVAAVDFVAGDDPDTHVALAYHKADLLTPLVQPIDEATPEYAPLDGAVDDPDGAPLEPVAPWTDPDAPPWGADDPADVDVNVPAAVVAGARPRVVVTPATAGVSARARYAVPALPEGAPALRVVVDGGDPVGDGAWSADAPVALDLAAAEATVGRSWRALTLRWEAQTDAGWVALPGEWTSTHRLYRLAGPPQLRDGTEIGAAPPLPWVGTLDELAPAVEGLPPDPAAVLDAIRDHLHHNEWVIYDPSDGDYSGYEGPYIYWEYTWSELTGWLDRDDGVRLYCHSLSCLLSVLAGSQGVYAPQQVLGVGFTTNLVRAANTEDWLRWGFNSHSVVSPDDGATIWDASIDLDGDDDPSSTPVTPLAPKGLPAEEYLWRLTYDPISIVNSGLCYVY